MQIFSFKTVYGLKFISIIKHLTIDDFNVKYMTSSHQFTQQQLSGRTAARASVELEFKDPSLEIFIVNSAIDFFNGGARFSIALEKNFSLPFTNKGRFTEAKITTYNSLCDEVLAMAHSFDASELVQQFNEQMNTWVSEYNERKNERLTKHLGTISNWDLSKESTPAMNALESSIATLELELKTKKAELLLLTRQLIIKDVLDDNLLNDCQKKNICEYIETKNNHKDSFFF